MRLWMKLSVAEFELLQNMGKLTADQTSQAQAGDGAMAYHWITEELEKDVCRPEDCHYPVKVWYQSEGKKFVKGVRKSAEEATEVLITLEIPEEEVKLFDGKLFHFVEEGQYIPQNQEDEQRYKKVLEMLHLEDDAESLQEVSRQRRQDTVASCLWKMVTDSWHSIFDTRKEDNFLFGSNSKKTIQAFLWQIRMDQVRRVEYL